MLDGRESSRRLVLVTLLSRNVVVSQDRRGENYD
jgi:hypothetical protein